MSAYKDKTQGTWYVSFRYIDWTGKKTQKLKRGFKTKKEALNYEKEFIRKTAADMKMEMNSFIQVYFEDKKNELKENSIRNKQHMMNKHIVPYFGTRKMNEITPAEIIQWQNTIQEKGYSKTYERMIQNQLNALFNHAQKIYNLKENPCKKVKKMGKSDANKLEFWTKAEYDRFIAGIEPGSEDYLIFEILFWTGIREGELLALSLSDFDMSGNLLHINKTYNRIRKRDVIDTPKTENSVRTIDIPNFLKEEVQEYAKKYYGFPEDQRLFPIVARTLQKRLKKYEALTGVKPIRVHDIRHPYVKHTTKKYNSEKQKTQATKIVDLIAWGFCVIQRGHGPCKQSQCGCRGIHIPFQSADRSAQRSAHPLLQSSEQSPAGCFGGPVLPASALPGR